MHTKVPIGKPPCKNIPIFWCPPLDETISRKPERPVDVCQYHKRITTVSGNGAPEIFKTIDRLNQYWDYQKSMVVNALVVESHGVAILHTLRYIQISCLGYFNDKMYLPNATFPDFAFLEQNIRLRTFGNLPPMPAEFYYTQQANNRTAATAPATTPSATTTTGRSSNTRSNDRKADPVTAPDSQIVKEWNEKYVAKKKSLYTLRTEAAGKLPKTTDNTTLICFAYHLCGQCFDVCRSKSTHRPLNADKTTTIQRFVDKHL